MKNNVTKYIVALLSLLIVMACEKRKTFEQLDADVKSSITVTISSALVVCEVSTDAQIQRVSVVYSENSKFDDSKTITMQCINENRYSVNLENLYDDHEYWFYYTIETGSRVHTWGEVQKFKTLLNNTLTVSPAEKSFDCFGGAFKLEIKSNTSWSISHNGEWCDISVTEGKEDSSVDVDVMPNFSSEESKDTITIKTKDGFARYVTVSVDGFAGEVTKDCQGNIYPVVSIGSQKWMAQSLMCSQYDTESEAYKAGTKTIPVGVFSESYNPYYVDGRYVKTDFTGVLNASHRSIIGFLYNWTAAMGYTTSQASGQIGDYNGVRQGVCPNGWHLPNVQEWHTLAEAVGGELDEYGNYKNAGTKLKSKSGWYGDGYGTNDIMFNALPAGYANGDIVYNMGLNFYAYTTDVIGSDSASVCGLRYDGDYMFGGWGESYIATSVRCVKNYDTPESLVVSPMGKTFDYYGGSCTITVNSNAKWKVVSNKTWCRPSTQSGSGNGTVTLNVSASDAATADTAYVTFSTISKRKIATIIRVGHFEPTLSVTPTSKTINATGGSFSIDVTSNTTWSVSCSDSWITLYKSGGTGNASVNVDVSPTSSTGESKATIIFKTESGLSRTVTVTRNGVAETLNVTPLSKTITSDGGTFDVTVTSNTQWSVTSNATWCKVSKTSGTGNATVTVTVASGTGTTKDEATLTFKTNGGITQKVQVTRNPALSVTPDKFYYRRDMCSPGGYHGCAFEITSLEEWYVESWTLPSYCILDKYSGIGQSIVHIEIDNNKIDCFTKEDITINVISGKHQSSVVVSIEPCSVNFSAKQLNFPAQGGGSTLLIELGCGDLEWVLGSDVHWIEFNRIEGVGTDMIDFKVKENTEIKSDVGAIYLTVKSKYGSEKNITLTVNREGLIVKDCQGHTYPVVKIGEQYWMAENLQCTKYDTQSERAGEVISTSTGPWMIPYYNDGRNSITEYSGNLTSEQRSHLGLLYNWTAAMGYSESQVISRTYSYSGKRQGICPNGWHLPNETEWNILSEYCRVRGGGGASLKSKSGWYAGGNGTDDYGFCGLPAGFTYGEGEVDNVGWWGCFWSSDDWGSKEALIRQLNFQDAYLTITYKDQSCALSVRCIKN